MRERVVPCAVALMMALAAATATAQTSSSERQAPMPAPGTVAIGVSTGFALPSESALKGDMGLAANIDRYLTSRVSIRGQVSGAWAAVSGRPFSGTVSPIALNGNLVYNWEGGAWHPYVTGGVGFYHYRFNEASLFSTDNKLGTNVGGGTELFLSRHDSVTGEVIVHVVPGQIVSRLTTYQPSYWTLGFGYKKYFGR